MKKPDSKSLSLILSFISVLSVVIAWQIISPFQLDNDNIYLKTIASGEMTGVPCAHMLHMGALSGCLISFLYRLTGNGIPWFGLFLCSAMGMTMVLILYRCLNECRKKISYIILIAVFILFFSSVFYRYFVFTQFTLSTGILGVGSLFIYYDLAYEKKIFQNVRYIVVMLAVSALSIGMREDAFLILVPFFGVVFLIHILNKREKEELRSGIILLLVFLVVIATVYLGNKVFYSGSEWKSFTEYNTFRAKVVDYDGYPDYDEYTEVYNDLGITVSSYNAMKGHYSLIFDPGVDLDMYKTLLAVSEPSQVNVPLHTKFFEVTKAIIARNLSDYEDRPVNIFVFAGYLLILILVLLQKKYRALIDMFLILVARMFDWYYLVWNGRYPFRVTQIIYVAELAMLVILAIRYKVWEFGKSKKGIPHPVFIMLGVLIVFTCFRFGLPVMKKYRDLARGLKEMSVCFTELEDYMESHEDCFYIFDMSHLYYTEDTLSFTASPYENYVYTGSWMVNSPWYDEKLKRHGIEDPAESLINDDKVFLIYQEVDFDTFDFMIDFYDEHYPGTEFVLIETLVTSNDMRYDVYKPVYK